MAMKVRGGQMVPQDSMDTKEFLTDLAEADRLLWQVRDRLRKAMANARRGDVNKLAVDQLNGLGDLLGQVSAKLQQASQNT